MKGRSSHNSKVKRIAYSASIFALIILFGLWLPKLFHSVGAILMTPAHVVNQWYETSEQALPVMLREKRDLQEEIAKLKNELLTATGQDLTIRRLQDENLRLRALLGGQPLKRTMARVIARPNEIPYDLLQVDKGESAGIKEHSLVYVGGDQLIGSVRQTAKDYSFVELFTTPGVEMTGFISGPDIIATVEGVGGGVARVRVPQGIPMRVGDLVYVPSAEPGLFGKIGFVENRPSQPEQFGYITLPISIQGLLEVAIADVQIEPATVESIKFGTDRIVNQRWLVEEANTGSFEELLATSSPSEQLP